MSYNHIFKHVTNILINGNEVLGSCDSCTAVRTQNALTHKVSKTPFFLL